MAPVTEALCVAPDSHRLPASGSGDNCSHEVLRQVRPGREVEVEVAGQECGCCKARRAFAEAAAEVEGFAGGFDRGVVELVPSKGFALICDGVPVHDFGPAVPEGELAG